MACTSSSQDLKSDERRSERAVHLLLKTASMTLLVLSFPSPLEPTMYIFLHSSACMSSINAWLKLYQSSLVRRTPLVFRDGRYVNESLDGRFHVVDGNEPPDQKASSCWRLAAFCKKAVCARSCCPLRSSSPAGPPCPEESRCDRGFRQWYGQTHDPHHKLHCCFLQRAAFLREKHLQCGHMYVSGTLSSTPSGTMCSSRSPHIGTQSAACRPPVPSLPPARRGKCHLSTDSFLSSPISSSSSVHVPYVRLCSQRLS